VRTYWERSVDCAETYATKSAREETKRDIGIAEQTTRRYYLVSVVPAFMIIQLPGRFETVMKASIRESDEL
jgi:hypothetical protein